MSLYMIRMQVVLCVQHQCLDMQSSVILTNKEEGKAFNGHHPEKPSECSTDPHRGMLAVAVSTPCFSPAASESCSILCPLKILSKLVKGFGPMGIRAVADMYVPGHLRQHRPVGRAGSGLRGSHYDTDGVDSVAFPCSLASLPCRVGHWQKQQMGTWSLQGTCCRRPPRCSPSQCPAGMPGPSWS